jgi:hypothetical protein
MAQLSGVNIERLEGGLGRISEGTDNHLGYVVGVIGAPVIAAVNNGGKGIVLASAFDAEQVGINEAYDANNEVSLYSDIVDFFRLAPEATLYLFNSSTVNDVRTWLNNNKEIKGFGVTKAYDVATSNVATNIADYQVLINELSAQNRLIDFAVIGLDGLDVFTQNLFESIAPQTSILVACEKADGHVAVLTFLAMLAVRKISENVGSVDIVNKPLSKRGRLDYPLTDTLLERWTESFLPDGRSIESLNKTELTAIINKGYIVAAQYEGYSGYFFENSYTAVERGSDFAQIENNRVWNKAARIIRATLLPRVKSKVKKDPTTGFIATTTTSYWKGLIEKALEGMQISDDISGYEVSIDNKQIVNDTTPVRVKALVVADGIVHEFTVAVGLTNNI